MTQKEKEIQLEYKNRHTEVLNKVWKGSPKMIDYCLKECSAYVPLSNNNFIILEKPKIKTRFCFGYRLNSQDTEEFDDANDMAHYARTQEDYFKEENLKGFDEAIKNLKDKSNKFYLEVKYCNEDKNDSLKSYNFFDPYRQHKPIEEYNFISDSDRNAIIKALEEEKQKFTKRLNSYLKRYGLSKVTSWSYWADE